MEKNKTKLAALFSSRGLMSTATSALLIGIVIAVNVIVYALTVGFGLYIVPKTETYDLSLSGETDALFADAIENGEKIEVLFCRSEDKMPSSMTDATDNLGVFYLTACEFLERYPDLISFEFVNILTRRNSKGETIDLSKYQIKDENGTIYPIIESSVIFVSGDRHKTIADAVGTSFVYDETVSTNSYTAYCGQEIFAAMAAWVLKEEHKTVYFTSYHSESIDSALGNMISCAGYEMKIINLRREPVPEDAAMVVISNPKTDFERAAEGSSVRSEIERLKTYVEGGGKIYVSLDPFVGKLPILESFLAEYGISYAETEREGTLYRNIIKDSSNSIGSDNLTVVADYSDNELSSAIAETVKKYNSSALIVRDCSALELSLGAESVLVSSSTSATYAGSARVDNSGNYCIAAVADVENKDGENGRIFVIPSVSLSSNYTLVNSEYANREFIYALIDHAFGGDSVPYGCNVIYLNTGILQNLTSAKTRAYTVVLFLIPAALAAVGAVVVTKRKNR